MIRVHLGRSRIYLMLIAFLLTTCLAWATAPRRLHIAQASDWDFVGGAWSETADGTIKPPDPRTNGDYYYAFYRGASYSDLEATFKMKMEMNFCDVGFIVRAQDPSNFYLFHFPTAGQQYRAQHFWAAVSKMDSSGYLRPLKLALVQRVPSNLGIWHEVRLVVGGSKLQLWVDGHLAIEVIDKTFLPAGRIGFAGFTQFGIKDVVVTGKEIPPRKWDPAKKIPRNYFVPVPDTTFGTWQHRPSLVRGANGDLLMLFSTTREADMVDPTKKGNVTVVNRSRDKGKTWSKPEPMESLAGFDIHSLNDGRLVALRAADNLIWRSESTDQGRTWSQPVQAPTGSFPSEPPKISGTYFVQLKNGTLIQYLIGGSSWNPKGFDIRTWGILHCQAFSIRSTDGGHTWSAPVNLDGNPAWPPGSKTPDGNLDLTEAVGVETSGGRVLTLIRPIYSPWMWETWSDDGGKTWGPAVRGPFPGYAPSPMLRTSSGAILIATRFPGTTIHTSYDEGRTWDEGTYIDSCIWAMGDMVEIEPNLILFVYMDSFQGFLRAQFIRVGRGGLQPVREGTISQGR